MASCFLLGFVLPLSVVRLGWNSHLLWLHAAPLRPYIRSFFIRRVFSQTTFTAGLISRVGTRCWEFLYVWTLLKHASAAKEYKSSPKVHVNEARGESYRHADTQPIPKLWSPTEAAISLSLGNESCESAPSDSKWPLANSHWPCEASGEQLPLPAYSCGENETGDTH